jgi:signal transduction histidine kinase/ligand-binding sensor domain-containing protein
MERRAANRTQAKACATLIILACCPCASALNPSLDINQYAHTAWTVREGFFKGFVYAIAQTPDGYLRLGTEFGVLRFDGVRTVPWEPPAGKHLPSGLIRSLLVARDGRLWIGTQDGLASWKDGTLAEYPKLAGQRVYALVEDREGTIWAGSGDSATGRLCALQSGNVKCYGEDGSLGSSVDSLYEDSQGNLWVGATTGLWRWKPGPPKLYPVPAPEYIQGLIGGENGGLLIAKNGGIRQLIDGKGEAYPLPGAPRQLPSRLLRDRNGGLWIGTRDRGLVHVHQGKTDVFARSDGLSSDFILGLFEDREGNIWVATSDGLDRFRDFAAATISVKQGLSNDLVWSVLAARDGSVWLGTVDGLNRWNDGRATIYRKGSGGLPGNVNSLFQDEGGRIWVCTLGEAAWFDKGRFIPVGGVPGGQLRSIAGDRAGNLWISQDQSLFHLLGGSVVEQIPWAKLGRKDYAFALQPDRVGGGLWLGFYLGGVIYFRDGQLRASYAATDGLGGGSVAGLHLDADGTLWAATQGGLSRVKDGHVATLTSKNGLPCDTVLWVEEDDDHSFWLYTACGLVRILRTELDAWVKDPKRTIRAAVFDNSDGVRSRAGTAVSNGPRVAKSADGKLWFATLDGVSVIDPRHLPFNNLLPPVHIEQITADRKKHETSSNLHLPPLVRDLEIDYTALSLVAAEKVFFRVKLEGRDTDWKDMGNERKAFYNDLPPRNYRFRVMASNNSGVWNEAGAAFDFSVAPAYYQTRWFQVSCAAAFFLMLWALYRLRLHQIAQQFNGRLEVRVEERTRIARELHDTLLQSFQALMFHFQAVNDVLPPGKGKEALEKVLDRADQAIVEGRNAIQNIRSSTTVTNELSHSVTALGEELAGSSDGEKRPAAFRVSVEGTPRELHPILRDDIYRIAREALRNAFHHAQASQIEAEITYGERLLRLRVRDDGKGIDPKHLHTGRDGHWGLPGMRERAREIGAQLEMWSEVGAGTEVELSIPGSIAYETAHRRGGLRLFRKKKEGSDER